MKTSDIFMRAEMMISRLIIKFLKIQDSDKNKIKNDGKRQGDTLATTNRVFGQKNLRNISVGRTPSFQDINISCNFFLQ